VVDRYRQLKEEAESIERSGPIGLFNLPKGREPSLNVSVNLKDEGLDPP